MPKSHINKICGLLKDRKVIPGRRAEKTLERRWRWLLRQVQMDNASQRKQHSKVTEVGIGGISCGGKGEKRRHSKLHFAIQ